MHNTLEEFYNYLAEVLFDFFGQATAVRPGDRFSIHFQEAEDVAACLRCLVTLEPEIVRAFEYQHHEGSSTFTGNCLQFGDVKLILATSLEASENYLTLLRNEVAEQRGVFENTAILVLFNGQLDSLIGGTGDLTLAGMPLSFEYFEHDILSRLRDTFKGRSDKRTILELAFKEKRSEFRLGELSLFDFKHIVAIIQSGEFNDSDYHLLGLFPHFELTTITDTNRIREKVEENNLLFEHIENVVNYGNVQTDLDRVLIQSGLDKIEAGIPDGSWMLLDYTEVAKFKIKPEKDKPVDYIGLDRNLLSDQIEAWERKDTKNSRIRHILIFNNSGVYPISQRFNFSAPLRGKLTVTGGESAVARVERAGKQIELVVNMPAYNNQLITFEYEDQKVITAKYRFRVCVINGSSAVFQHFSAKYSLSPDGQLLIDAEGDVRFNAEQPELTNIDLAIDEHYTVDDDSGLILDLNNEDEEIIPFTLHYRDQALGLCVKQQIGLSKPVKGWDVWQNKRIEKKSYDYIYSPEQETLKILLNNDEFAPRDDYRRTLLLESALMDFPALAWYESSPGIVKDRPLRLAPRLKIAYFEYFEKIKAAGTLPSLFYLDDEARQIAIQYVDVFLAEVSEISEDAILQEETKADLIALGSVSERFGNQVVKLSPLHPLMVAYQLEIYGQVKQHQLYEAMLKKLTPLNLLPYVYWQSARGERQLYASKENNHSPEWQYYSSDIHFKQFSGREFIRDLVSQKIHEFITNFFFLFAHDRRAPIRINVFNMGDCLQVLQGIFDYYKERAAANEPLHELRPITLHIFGSENYVTTFEKMSHLIAQEDIERSFELGTINKRIPFEDLLNAFRSKVQYYAIGENEGSTYAHLTFYQFGNGHTSKTYRDYRKIPSGLSLNGLLNDLPSYYQDQTYITGFGTEYVFRSNRLIDTAKAYNALAQVSFSRHPFARDRAICTTIDHSIKHDLGNLYDHSQWVVFVDPHFDLTFFKDEKDLIIVHYSDQHSNASGFDAITVSRKSQQYCHLLESILDAQKIAHSKAKIFHVINLYNAINGQWLIKMIGKKDDRMRKEKLSIPAAAKLFLAYFDHPEIIWVPVSLEEILRVSGGAGLSKSEGLFSTANLGAKNEHGDDLLMIGLYEKGGDLHLQFYPVEVKIGINNSDVLNKGRLQAKKTYQLIYDHLNDGAKGFESAFYRSFFAKLAIMNAGKMQLYEVWPEKNWAKVTTEYRSRLLNDEFVVSTGLSSYINDYALIAFTQSAYVRSYEMEQEGILLTHFEEDAYKYLVEGVEEIKYWLHETPNSIKREQLLVSALTTIEDLPEFEPHDNVAELPTIPEPEAEPEYPATLVPQIEDLPAEAEVRSPLRILFGSNINNGEPVYWYPTDTTQVMHSNTGIIGTMGTGKTQFTKSLVTQLYRESKYNVDGKPIGLLIFDYKGDYINEKFVTATNAKVYGLYNLPFNPLAIDATPRSVPLLPLHIASTLQETISLAFNLGNKQKALLKDVIMKAYEEKGIFKSQPETWNRVAPTIADVYDCFMEDERMSMDSLYAALNQLAEYQIFQPNGHETTSLYELIDGVAVINLSGYSADLQNLVVAITLDAFYSQMQKNGHSVIQQNYRQITKMILVDEADNFLSKNFVSIRKILKEGREFGVGTLLSTQFLNHFSTSDNEYAQYILTWVAHRVNDIKQKDVESLFPIIDKDQKEQLIQMIKKLEKHFSVVNLAGSKPIFIEDYPFWKLIS